MLKLLALAGPAVSVDPLTDALWPGQALEAVWAELEPGDSSVTVNVTFVYIDARIIELVSATDQLATIGWTVLTSNAGSMAVVEAEPKLSVRLGGVRGSWDRQRAVAVAVGGVVGAALRWAVFTSVDAGRFPWPVLAVNVAGSLVLGVLLAEEWSHPRARLLLHDAGGIGFCGSFTTFSTFAVDVVDLTRDGDVGIAVVYVVASIVSTLAAVVAGAGALRRLRAVILPLEEQP